MQTFLDTYGWSLVKTFPQDGSSRRYARVSKGEKSAVLMEVLADTPGHRIEDFIRIGEWLNEIGLKAPQIYEADAAYLLIEDFGDRSFKDVLAEPRNHAALYELAHDVLKHLAAQKCSLDLPRYYDSHVHKGHRRVVDWFIPAIRAQANPDALVDEYLSVWERIEQGLPECPQGFLHVDFHVQNLMWLGKEQGLKQCGILDFQGAMIGPQPYDLANLLEDVRTDVPADIRCDLLAQYDEDFQAHYRILATQFHCRVIGQFIKMAVVDGRDEYLRYLPRAGHYISMALSNPLLGPLKRFFCDLNLDFDDIKGLNADEIRGYIASDAF
ncbi:MAG: phosphotransferase [Alphaproteobacteria bacterium]|nr:phosphotransferase [Alphaproteobacteria bacterium]